MDKIKDFFLNQLSGRLIVRASISIAAYLASGSVGLAINVDPTAVAALLTAGLNMIITKLKPREKAVEPTPAVPLP